MYRSTNVFLSIVVLFVLSGTTVGQSPDKSDDSAPKLQPVFNDDFSKDTRSDYVTEG